LDLATFDCFLPILSRQALINGAICLTVAVLFIAVIVLGSTIIRMFLKSEHKVEDRWLAIIGTSLVIFGTLGFILFLWFGLPRVLNPTFYALDYYLDVVKFSKGIYKP
jgi:hypothetical protein